MQLLVSHVLKSHGSRDKVQTFIIMSHYVIVISSRKVSLSLDARLVWFKVARLENSCFIISRLFETTTRLQISRYETIPSASLVPSRLSSLLCKIFSMQTGKTSNDYQPIPNVPGHVALLSNGSMLLESVGPQDEGHYLCRASNGIGSVLNKMIYVEVNGNKC